MIINFTGFELGSTLECDKPTTAIIQNKFVKSGNYALKTEQFQKWPIGVCSAKNSSSRFNKPIKTIFSRFWFRYNSGEGTLFSVIDSSHQAKLTIEIIGDSVVVNDISVIANLSKNEWHLIETRVSTGPNSEFSVKIDEEFVITENKTHNLPATHVVLGGSSSECEFYFDDVILDDSQFPQPAEIIALELENKGVVKNSSGRPPHLKATNDAVSMFRLKRIKEGKVLAAKIEMITNNSGTTKAGLRLRYGTKITQDTPLKDNFHFCKFMSLDLKNGFRWTPNSLKKLEIGIFTNHAPGEVNCSYLGGQILLSQWRSD